MNADERGFLVALTELTGNAETRPTRSSSRRPVARLLIHFPLGVPFVLASELFACECNLRGLQPYRGNQPLPTS